MSSENIKKIIIFILSLLVLYFAPLFVAQCEAAQTYQITAEELQTLKNNLTKLEKINQQSAAELATLKNQLAISAKALNEAKKESQRLTQQLNELKADSEQQQQLLQTANQSLKQYAQEEKAKQRSLERQRNIAYIIAAGLLYVAVK